MRKIDKILLSTVVSSIPLSLIIFFIYSGINVPSTQKVILGRAFLIQAHGVVDSLVHNTNNHNVKVAILSSHEEFEGTWESKIEVGDSLSKNKGSYLLKIFKKDKKKEVLDYQSTIKATNN